MASQEADDEGYELARQRLESAYKSGRSFLLITENVPGTTVGATYVHVGGRNRKKMPEMIDLALRARTYYGSR